MTGFILPELIIESIIRDGILNIQEDETIIDDVFKQLTRPYNSRKYGESELTKIKAMVQKEIAVIYTYADVDSKSPCFSIMIGNDGEDTKRAHLGDHYDEVQEEIVDPDTIEALVRVANLNVTAYNATTGKVTCDSATNLAAIYKGMIYEDAAETEHLILGGISNATGDKFFFIGKNEDVDFTDVGEIRSSLDYQQYEIKGVSSDEHLVVGVHAKDPLTVKYLYILLKYFINSRKKDIISRGLYNLSFSGSDFTRNEAFTGDHVFSRYLTIIGKIDDTWRSDQVVLIDNIEVDPTPIE